MKVSLNWMQWYSEVDLKSLPVDELVKLATERLGGIEGVENLSKHYEGIVVAKVVSCVKHPNADKLSLCLVDDGGIVKDVERNENGYVQVVCGAPNVKEGLLVAWIPPGSIVPASYGEKELFVLEARDLRGELSNGMLASPAELGMNDDHSGILEIDEEAQPGTLFKELYGLDDTILEIENKMFTHRPDGFGQLGVARELAGIQHKAFKSPEWYLSPLKVSASLSSDEDKLNVTVESEDLCPRYMAVVLEDVKIKPSPVWLQSYLKRVGVRPINNVVDITNYIMLLTAQPLHAFDFDKVAKDGAASIIVRRPQPGEKMSLLDGKEIEPHKDAVLICNPDGPIALGGVMGGGNSEIDENTTRIVLECATFDMYNIRKTSMIHGLFTDAVTRFNKGQPAAQLPAVLSKTVEMLKELSGANPASEVVDVVSSAAKLMNEPVHIDTAFINNRLGSNLTATEISSLLTNVEFSVETEGEVLIVTPPFWRTDIEIKEDVVEEIGRLYGFNQLPIALPTKSIIPVAPDSRRELKRRIRYILARAGANEVLTYSFVHGDILRKAKQNPENSYAIRNALSPDLQYYRQTLTPSLLDLVHANSKAGFDEFALFELNKSHNKIHGDGEDGLPGELNMLALTFASKNSKRAAFYNVRRYLDYLASSLGFTLRYSPIVDPADFPVTAPFDQTRSALVVVEETDTFLGIVGEYQADVAKKFKLPQASAGFEVGLDHLLEALQGLSGIAYTPLSKYPSTTQDITLQVSQETRFADIESCLKGHLKTTSYQWNLVPISIFQKADQQTKNVTFRLILSHYGHTLTTNEASQIVKELSWQAHEQLKAEQV